MADPADSSSDTILVGEPVETAHAVVHRLLTFFQSAITHQVWKDWREHAAKDYRFREGDHWEPQELKVLADRGQPPTIRNEIKPIIDRVHGQFLQTRQSLTFLARNSPADDAVSQLKCDLHRHVDQSNEYEFHEADVALHGLTGGFGVIEENIRLNDQGRKEIFIDAQNPFDFYPDPFSLKPDWSDAKFVIRAKWMDLDDAIARWPEQEMALRTVVAGNSGAFVQDFDLDSRIANDVQALFVDPNRRRIRPVECWYRRKVELWNIYGPDGITVFSVPIDVKEKAQVMKVLPGTFSAKKQIVDQMWVGVFCSHVLIHHDKSPLLPCNRFPFVPFFADRKVNGEPFGLVRPLVPIQEALNKRESKALNMLSNRRIIAEENAIKDPTLAQQENAKADGYVETAPGAISQGRVQFPDNQDVGQAQVALTSMSMAAMPRVSGINDESMGMRTEVRSGIGIARKQQMTNLIVNPVVNNLRRFRRNRAKLQDELIELVYTEEMAFQVTDDPNTPRLVQVSRDHLEAMRQRTYDIVVDDHPDYATVREQELDMLFTLWPQIASLGPGMMKVALAMTNLREKQGLIKMIDQASQPPAQQPKMSLALTWADLSPEMQAYLAYSALQAPALAEAILKQGADPAFLAKIKADLAKTQIKEGTRAAVERGKLDLTARATQIEGLMKAAEFGQTAYQAQQEAMNAGTPPEV